MSSEEQKHEDPGPSNTLERFVELEQVLHMIDTVRSTDAKGFEKEYEQFSEILSRYQEQPHLLDSHLELMLGKLLDQIRNPVLPEDKIHAAFKYMYVICKVRTYKVLVKFLPHELSDLEFALDLLEKQNPKEFKQWETRYILLLWLSILVLNPFHMSRLDAYVTEVSTDISSLTNNLQAKTKMERIFDLCKLYTEMNDTCSQIAAYLSAKFLVRADIKEVYLELYLEWVMNPNNSNTVQAKCGQLAAVAAILKHGKREDMLPYADKLLHWIIGCGYKNSSDFLKYKFYIKIIQRIGLIYLKPRIADWRYKRGTRSLALNLTPSSGDANQNTTNSNDNIEAGKTEGDMVPDAIEEVIEELMQGLRSGGNDIRWSAAKGLGRVSNRLDKELADEVIGSVIDILNPLEPHEAWHGGCLALAELAKRGLLLPYRLSEILPLLNQALFYDEMKGYMSVGQHIRDSACYMCWAFARAYNPEDLQPFVCEISAGLLTVASFDREINCRRAASAAFQESVGRLGNFPHGIEICTATDFYSVGLRQNSFLNVSDFVTQFEEYQKPLIDHLVERKLNHWDCSIRELAAKALYKLSLRAPRYVASVVLPQLFQKTDSIDVNTRHGSVLAIGEVTLALRKMEMSSNENQRLLSNQSICDLNELVGKFLKRDLFKGMTGEYMKKCSIDFVRNCSLAKIEVSSECLDSWQDVIDKCVVNKNEHVRESAARAFSEMSKSFYDNPDHNDKNIKIIRRYLEGAENDLEEHIRMGYIGALGALPIFMISHFMDEIIDSLVKHSLTPLQAVIAGEALNENEYIITHTWSEARRESVKALSNFIQTVGFKENTNTSIANTKYLHKVLECLLKAMSEYTLDNRGDIGAWVREAAMTAVYQLLIMCPKHLLTAEYVHKIILCFVQQSVEKIDRTRGLAGRMFCNIINTVPPIPNILHHERLKEIFPEDADTVLWLFADHTFPMFCALLEFPEYSRRVLLGLSASIGQLTESLIKYSSSAFFQFLRAQPGTVPRLCKEIVINFEDNLLNERVTYPMLNFLEIVISSGAINAVLLDETARFADDIFRLVNLEIKGYKKLYKLVSSINVFCQLIQVTRLCKKILAKMSIFLGLTHVHVRKTTATKLYEALALYGDSCPDISEENMEEILSILSETDWGLPLREVRPIRNNLCALLGIQVPLSAKQSRISTAGICA